MTTRSPAAETAAAVSAPLIALAMVKPESTSMMMNRMMMPRGVRIMLIMLPVELEPLPNLSNLLKDIVRGSYAWIEKYHMGVSTFLHQLRAPHVEPLLTQ